MSSQYPLVVRLKSGVTEAEIQIALNSLSDGGILIFPENEVIEISKGLILNIALRSVSLDLNGSTLQQSGDVTVLAINGAHAPGTEVQLELNSNLVKITHPSPSSLVVGDWIKIYADDPLPNDQGAATRLGQAMRIASVVGDEVTLEGELLYADEYRTNIRASAYMSGTAVVANGTVQGDQSNPNWNFDLVALRSTVGATIEQLVVRDGNSIGINVIDGVNTTISQSAAFNLSDDVSSGRFGYAVHSASSLRTVVDGFYAENVRHATDNNAVGFQGPNENPSKYGADIGLESTNVVVNAATATAFSWHTEARQSSVHDSISINSWGVLGARGLDNTMFNVAGAYNERGIQFMRYGNGDGSFIKVNNVQLSDLSLYAFSNVRDVHDNKIENSWFEVNDQQHWDFAGIEARSTIIVESSGSHSVIAGTDANDRLLGTDTYDKIWGASGNDYIWGGSGPDDIVGGNGSDRFAYFDVAEGGDIIRDFDASVGGDIIDLSVLALRNDWRGELIATGFVNIVQHGKNSIINVFSGSAEITLATIINSDAEQVAKQLSTTILVSDTGLNVNRSADGRNTPNIYDWIGSEGDDYLFGTSERDRIVGDSGSDHLYGFGGGDTFLGGEGKDMVSYRYAQEAVTVDLLVQANNDGGAISDRYSQIEQIEGSAFGDKIVGNNGMNKILGSHGDDKIWGNGGVDDINGGPGQDALHGGDRNDALVGGTGDDLIFGDDGDDLLDGGSGADQLIGGNGTDRLDDYEGIDVMTGGDGSDIFVWNKLSGGSDSITDFEPEEDRLYFSRDDLGVAVGEKVIFTESKAATYPLDVGQFAYDVSSGILSYQSAKSYHTSDLFVLENRPLLSWHDIVLL